MHEDIALAYAKMLRADNDHTVGNSVESLKDESKPHKCPEEKWDDAENNNNVCELFYNTRSGDEWDRDNNGHDSVAISDSFEKADAVFYMDKNVTACDLPEIVVCYKEKTYHVVKDICVDEGVPVHEKFLFGEKEHSSETKSLEDGNCKLDDSELCNDPKSNQDVEESERDEVATSENVLKESLKPLNNSNNSHRREEQSPHQEKGTRSLETTTLKTEHEETEEPRKTEEKLSSVSTRTSQEPNITFNDPERPDGFGETIFSAAEAVSISGHITYSGPIVLSGSLSVRSDASTASGRSFAFPVLQSGWNSSSPVRMVRANKKRQKGWRDILLCCRFS